MQLGMVAKWPFIVNYFVNIFYSDCGRKKSQSCFGSISLISKAAEHFLRWYFLTIFLSSLDFVFSVLARPFLIGLFVFLTF